MRWSADKSGTYSVRVGGTNCTGGTQVAGGSYASAGSTVDTVIAGASLSEGSNPVVVCVTDALANTGFSTASVTKDTTVPQLTLPLDITVEATSGSGAAVSFSASATDNIDGSVPVTCIPVSGSTFGLGATTVNCSASDNLGNTGNGSFQVTVRDTTIPSLTLPSDIVAEATSPSGAVVSFSATATDVVDGSVPVTCVPSSGSTFALGETAVNCTATDTHGNTGGGSFKVTVVDTLAPSSTIDFPADGGQYNASLWDAGCGTPGGDVCGTKSDNGSGVQTVQISMKQVSTNKYWSGSAFDSDAEYFFNATGETGWSAVFAFGNFPADGTYVIHSEAIDYVGNIEAGPTATFTIDAAGPEITLTAPVNGSSTNDSTPDFTGVAGVGSYDLADITVRIYQGTDTTGTEAQARTTTRDPSTGAYAVSALTLADGTYTAQAEQYDSAGNLGLSSANTFTIDTVAPVSVLTFPASGPYNETSWTAGCTTPGFCGTASQTGAAIQKIEISILKVGDGYWSGSAFDSATEVFVTATGTTAWSYPFAFSQFADGSYTVHVRATDVLGNVETTGTTRTFVVDGTAPDTTITSSPSNPTSSTKAIFLFTSSETGSTFQCRLDGGTAGTCTSPKSYGYGADPKLTLGTHTFEVWATDAAGNVDSTPATYTWTVQ